MELTAERKYQLLLQISHKIRDTLDLDEILNHLLDMVGSVIAYDAAGIFVLNQDLVHRHDQRPQQLIAGVVLRGFDPGPPEQDSMLTLGKGIIGHVIRSGESLVAPDVRENAYYIAGRQGTLSEIAVPIIRNERPIGALNLESNELAAYREEDVEVLQFFADAAAISIEKAMLHRQILENQRLEEQLQLAHDVQSRLLPENAPQLQGYDIAGICISTHEIGGDCFDYLTLADGRLGVTVADVSGEGVPAALIMAAFRALLRTHARSGAEPAHIARRLNRLLPDFTGQVDFVTAVYGILDPASGRFTYVNCGHNPPILFRVEGDVRKLTSSGPGLGILNDFVYHEHSSILAPGDMLLLYTDGVTELVNDEVEEYGVPRLQAAVQGYRDKTATAMIEEIVRQTRLFAGVRDFADDFTLVVIKRKAAPAD